MQATLPLTQIVEAAKHGREGQTLDGRQVRVRYTALGGMSNEMGVSRPDQTGRAAPSFAHYACLCSVCLSVPPRSWPLASLALTEEEEEEGATKWNDQSVYLSVYQPRCCT
jgi:hypothetical protein